MSDCRFLAELEDCIHLDMEKVDARMHELEEILGYRFRDIRNLADAMCGMKIPRPHAGSNAKDLYNDSLATVGDAVIKLVLSERLFRRGCYKGDITQIKSLVEKNDTLFELSNSIGLRDYVFNENWFYPDAPKENRPAYAKHNQYFEAIVAAVFFDSDYETCKEWLIERFFTEEYLDHLIEEFRRTQEKFF